MGTSGKPLQQVIVDRFLYWTRFIWQQSTVRQ